MDLLKGLIYHYALNGNSNDTFGFNNGTDTNISYHADYGKLSQGASFNGTSSKITLAAIGGHTNFTINIWAKLIAYHDNGYAAIFQCNDGLIALNNEGGVDRANGAIWVDRNGTTGTNKLSTSNESHPGEPTNWNMYTLTANGTDHKFYVNGQSMGGFFLNTEGTSFAYTVLGYNHSNPPDVSESYFNGYMDDLGIWNRALSQQEINALYNSGNAFAYPYAQNLLTSLMSYWKMDEASGNAIDSHRSNTLTNNGTLTYTGGKINNCAVFTTNKYLSITDAAQSGLDITGDLSLGMWLYFGADHNAEDQMFILAKSDETGAQRSYRFNTYKTGGVLSLTMYIRDASNGDHYLTRAWSPTKEVWYYVAVTFNAATHTLKYYVNGEQLGADIDAVATSIKNSTAPLELGHYIDGSYQTNLRLDGVDIWARVLTADEISTLYNGGAGLEYPFHLNPTGPFPTKLNP